MANKILRLMAGLTVIAALRAASPDACSLLSPEAIQHATNEQVAHSKASYQTVRGLRQSRCFYTLPTFANSISVTLTGPAGLRRDAARELWERWFHHEEDGKDDGKREAEEEEAAAKGAPVTGVGDEAFWVHSFVGNLYVRKGNQVLRISLGGKMTDEERQAKAKALATDALRHLR